LQHYHADERMDCCVDELVGFIPSYKGGIWKSAK
jgi:hypothetical protein